MLTIGQLAKRADVKIDTIRYYEKEGLIPEPGRRDSGYRTYPESVVKRLAFIKRAKGLGFTLHEIWGLLSLRVSLKTPCGEVRRRADQKLEAVDEKIRQLERIREALKLLSAHCSGPNLECPFLDALDSGTGL